MNYFIVILLVAWSALTVRAQEAAPPENPEAPAPVRADLVVYGATPAGICAAIAAQQEGAGVLLYAPDEHVGGMLTSGLSAEQLENLPLLGGIARTFFERVGAEYGENFKGHFEPKVVARILDQMLAEAGITVLRDQRVLHAVVKQGRINGFFSEQGTAIAGTVYIDASYEGDLMEKSGVSYTYGRESRDSYGEANAGAMAKHPDMAQWDMIIHASAATPGVSTHPPAPFGEGDALLPGYSFRPVLTVNAGNRKEFYAPVGYREDNYRLLGQYLAKIQNPKLTDLFEFIPLSEGKYEVGPYGPFSTILYDGNRHYPDLDTPRRNAARDQHRTYLEGLLYFLATSNRIPKDLRRDMAKFGYALDEFTANGNFPPQLHISEARRMVGRQVLTQRDVLEDRKKVDSIAVGFYPIECGHLIRTFDVDRRVYNYGGIRLKPGKPYQIPYRCMTPMESECTNLLVPVCLSATHVAFGSINREPQWMMLGESAGVAAAMAIQGQKPVADVDITTLQERLSARHQIISAEPEAAGLLP